MNKSIYERGSFPYFGGTIGMCADDCHLLGERGTGRQAPIDDVRDLPSAKKKSSSLKKLLSRKGRC